MVKFRSAIGAGGVTEKSTIMYCWKYCARIVTGVIWLVDGDVVIGNVADLDPSGISTLAGADAMNGALL